MEYCEHPNKLSMCCDPTTCVEIYNLVMNLNNNKAPGPAPRARKRLFNVK